MSIIEKLARPDLINLQGYSSARNEQEPSRIALDANENPYSNENNLNRYPEPQPIALKKRLTKLYGIDEDYLLLTRGGDEGIDLLIRSFCQAGKDSIMITPPTYGMYEVAANIQAANIIRAPLLEQNNFQLDADSIINSWQPGVKLIFLCSPNNPTGNIFDPQAILSICQALRDKALIIVDEAYIEFSNTPSMSLNLSDFPNLVVLRTLSKAYALAGIRCGTLIANSNVIAYLRKIIAPYPIPTIVSNYICEYMDENKVRKQVEMIKQEREKMHLFLEDLSIVKKVWPSESNFLLTSVLDSQKIMNNCLEKGIVLRDRAQIGLGDCVRITIGTPEQNTFLKEVLANVKV